MIFTEQTIGDCNHLIKFKTQLNLQCKLFKTLGIFGKLNTQLEFFKTVEILEIRLKRSKLKVRIIFFRNFP